MRVFICGILSVMMSMVALADQVSLEEGQTWTFKNPPHPETRLVIGKIEPIWEGKESAVSVSIVRLNSERGLAIGATVSHLPFSEQALVPHLIEIDGTSLPLDTNFKGGYDHWKSALERGEAGVFTVSPAEAIEFTMSVVWEGQ